MEVLNSDYSFDPAAGLRIRWQAPTQGTIKLNTDGSFNPITTAAGGGGVLRDASGRWVSGFYCQVTDGDSALAAEAHALKMGLLICWDLGHKRGL